jgi:hypothetical protein
MGSVDLAMAFLSFFSPLLASGLTTFNLYDVHTLDLCFHILRTMAGCYLSIPKIIESPLKSLSSLTS